jgi:hypothetical protein
MVPFPLKSGEGEEPSIRSVGKQGKIGSDFLFCFFIYLSLFIRCNKLLMFLTVFLQAANGQPVAAFSFPR